MSTKRLAEVQAEKQLINQQLDEIEGLPEPEGEEALRAQILTERETKVDDLIARFRELTKEEGPLLARAQALADVRAAARDIARVEPGDGSRYLGGAGPGFNKQTDPFADDPRRISRGEVISRAMTVIDREKGVPISDQNKGHLEWLIHRSQSEDEDGFDGGYIAMRTLYTENPLYRSAFRKYVRFGALAHFNEGEHQAMAAFQDYEVRRAMGEVTTTAGGFGVPVLIDPSIIITSGALDAPILRICRVEQVTNNIWKGVSSAGMAWSYDTEAAEVSDDAATLAQPTVTVHMARGFIPYSIN